MYSLYKALFGGPAESDEGATNVNTDQKTEEIKQKETMQCSPCGESIDVMDPSSLDHVCKTSEKSGASKHDSACAQASGLKLDQNVEEDFHVEECVKEEWEREQKNLKRQLLLEDVDDWSKFHITHENIKDHPGRRALEYIGGVDISFVKGDNVNACAAFVVLKLPSLDVVYEDLSMVALTAPYIPGFLAFREADFLVEKIEKLRQLNPHIVPQVIMVDGNGILHPREFGLASHLGVLVDIPALGVAKKLFQVDGLEKNEEHKKRILQLEKGGDTFPLVGASGTTLGLALRSCNGSTNPIYVSQGHKLSLDTALWVTQICCKHRIPEPTRQADIRSREYLRQNFKPDD